MSQIICAHIEYKEFRYSYFGRVYLERDYDFFALLGGGPRQNEKSPVFPLRGMPAEAHHLTQASFYYLVCEHETDRERWISRREAEQWVESGDAQWVRSGLITDPDYFGPSWLLTEEFEQVYQAYQQEYTERLLSVEAALAAMRILPKARLVYWFGN